MFMVFSDPTTQEGGKQTHGCHLGQIQNAGRERTSQKPQDRELRQGTSEPSPKEFLRESLQTRGDEKEKGNVRLFIRSFIPGATGKRNGPLDPSPGSATAPPPARLCNLPVILAYDAQRGSNRVCRDTVIVKIKLQPIKHSDTARRKSAFDKRYFIYS